jgi:hypothetical protein
MKKNLEITARGNTRGKPAYMYLTPRTTGQNGHKNLERVKSGITSATWGNLDENLLNVVASVKKS